MKKNILEYNVDKEYELLSFLYDNISNSKNNIKSFLKNGKVFVNNKVITKYNYLLNKDDKVIVKLFHTNLNILYEDDYLIIVEKPSGMLTVSTDKIKDNTLYKEVSSYVKKNNSNRKIFIVNRLDKDTSGIVVFAKDKNTKYLLQSNWNNIVSIRKYVAVVWGITDKKGTIKSYLKENSNHIVYSSKTGKLSITNYEMIKHNNKFSMLNIFISTGRKNQIRVHMNDINHPIVGDNKYSSLPNITGRLMLHASYIEFINPINKKIIKVNCNYPIEFDNLF